MPSFHQCAGSADAHDRAGCNSATLGSLRSYRSGNTSPICGPVHAHPGGRWWVLLLAVVGSLLPLSAAVTESAEFMIKAFVDGKMLEGRPLSWSAQRVYLLARDGQLVNFRPEEARDFQKSSPRFFSYSHGEIRAGLYKEFGRQFDITGTGHYLVVHPRGQKDKWADRFERLYRSFNHYFRVRGFELKEPEYPLVAVVFHNRQDYQRYASRTGSGSTANTLIARLVRQCGNDHSRSDPPNGLQQRYPHPICQRTALAVRRTGNHVRGARCVGLGFLQ